MKKLIILSTFALLFLLTSCSNYISQEKLDSLKLGMTKQETVRILGKQGINKGQVQQGHDIVEFTEYEVKKQDARSHAAMGIVDIATLGLSLPAHLACYTTEKYWLCFVNDYLKSWGKPSNYKHTFKVKN